MRTEGRRDGEERTNIKDWEPSHDVSWWTRKGIFQYYLWVCRRATLQVSLSNAIIPRPLRWVCFSWFLGQSLNHLCSRTGTASSNHLQLTWLLPRITILNNSKKYHGTTIFRFFTNTTTWRMGLPGYVRSSSNVSNLSYASDPCSTWWIWSWWRSQIPSQSIPFR